MTTRLFPNRLCFPSRPDGGRGGSRRRGRGAWQFRRMEDGRGAAALVADWWTRQLAGGTAIVCLGAKSLRFSRLPDGTLAAATRPSGATDSFAYDALGRMVAATNALGAVFSVEYDAAGRSVLLTDALGGETDISRDALGRPTDTLDPMGRHRAAAFDALGRRVASVRPSGAADAFAFDALDGLVAITNAEGHVHSVFRDDTGRAVAATNAAGERVFSAEWTPLGLASRTDGRGVRLEFARDAFGRILAVSEGGTNTLAAVSRDDAGNYLAGYYAGYSESKAVYVGMRAGGLFFSSIGWIYGQFDKGFPHEDFWDQDSQPALEAGRRDAIKDLLLGK